MPTKRHSDDLRPEYNLAKLRGRIQAKYYHRAVAGTNLVLIEPDVASVFPDGDAVNEALRDLIRVADSHTGDGRRRKANRRSKLRSRTRKPRATHG